MAAFLVDIDATLVEWGTTTPLPGAIASLQKLLRSGNQVIFTTQRTP